VSKAETLKAFQPLADYLSDELGEPVRIDVPDSFSGFGKALTAREYDLAFAAPATILHHTTAFDLRPHWLAVAVDRGQGASLRGIFIVQKDSTLNGIRDLKGKRIAFVDKRSQGYLLLSHLLREAGVDPMRDIQATFHNKLDLTIQALLEGQADVAGVGDVIYTKLKNKIDLSRVRVVASSRAVPNWTLVGFDQTVSVKTKQSLLSLHSGSERATSVLSASHFSAFQELDPEALKLLQRAVFTHTSN